MPARGTTILPSRDTGTPPTPVAADVFLTPADFGIPPRTDPFTPKEIAGYLRVSSDEILGLIDEGQLRAFPVRRGKRMTYRVPYIEIVYFFLRQQGAANWMLPR